MAQKYKMSEVAKTLDELVGDADRAKRLATLKSKLSLSAIDAEVALVKHESAQRIARLKAEEAERAARLDAKIVEILKKERKQVYDELLSKAEAKLAAEASERSKRAANARGAQTPKSSEQPRQPAPQGGQQQHQG